MFLKIEVERKSKSSIWRKINYFFENPVDSSFSIVYRMLFRLLALIIGQSVATFASDKSFIGNQNLTASPITRDQIMQRAQVWVDEKVPYSQTATTDGYRQDCSGYVSYCWASSTSGGGHVTSNMQEICTKISKTDMKKGDAILKPSTHVLLFGGWIDSDAFYEYAEHQSGDVCRKSTGSYNYFATNGYFPCRYNLVSN
jgi:hypothetical protein